MERRVPIVCAAAALAIAAVALVATLSQHGWHASALVRMQADEPMAQLAERSNPDFSFVSDGDHYDGVYYYAIARDPFGLGEAHKRIDVSAYRYGHPGYGWLAGIASAGRGPAVPEALLAVNLLMLAAAAIFVSLIARDIGRSPWWGMLVAFNPGFGFAVTADTAEPTLMAFTALGVLLWLRGRHRSGAAALIAGCFIREAGVLVPVGLALYELAEWIREGRHPRKLGERANRVALLAIGPVLFAGWWVYIRAHFGAWPTFHPSNLALPGEGIADTLRRAARLGFGPFDQMQIGTASVPVIAAVSGAFVFGIARSLRVRTPFQGIVLALSALELSLNWYLFLYPKELIRTTTAPLTFLAFALLAPVTRASPRGDLRGRHREQRRRPRR